MLNMPMRNACVIDHESSRYCVRSYLALLVDRGDRVEDLATEDILAASSSPDSITVEVE